MNHVSAWFEGLQDHSCSNGGSQRHLGIRYLFLKTGMDGKQKTLSHHDQGKKEKVNDGKEDGPLQRSSSPAGCPAAEASLPKLLQQKFLKPFPKNLPGQSVPALSYPNGRNAFAGVSPQSSLHHLTSRSGRH